MTIKRTLVMALATTAGVVALANPAAADTDGRDFLVWQRSSGITAASTTSFAGAFDSDGDGDVDGRDFLVWQRGD